MKVIVLTLHGARLDAFGTYGGSLAATPHFDQFASQSVVFDQHYASHLAPDSQDESIADDTVVTLDELTAALTTNGGSSAYFADHRVMHHLSYTTSWKHVAVVNDHDLAALEQPTLSDAVLQHGIDWLQQYGQHYDSWLLNLELGALVPDWREEEFAEGPAEKSDAEDEAKAEPIFDYDPEEPSPAPSRFGWRLAYGGVMRYLDDLIGQFLKLLDELELTKECMFVVQSSSGQWLGEYGPVPDRSEGLNEERCHLPLIIRFPNGAGAGRRVHHFTQPEDVMVTVYQSLVGDAPVDTQGDHLVRFTQGQAGRYREYAVSVLVGQDEQLLEASLRSIYWNIIVPLHHEHARPLQLYRKPEDRWDMNNVVTEHPEVAEHLELTLRRWLAWSTAGCVGEPAKLRDEVVKVLAV
jgi:arylsulfatase A-like enzyme